jgi:hypothetical protein
MIGSFLLSKLWDADPIQSRGVQSYTTAYQLVPKSMDPAKGYGNLELQNIIVKFLQGLSEITLVWSHFLSTLMSHSFFTQHEITAAGEKNIAWWAAKRIFNENSRLFPWFRFKYELVSEILYLGERRGFLSLLFWRGTSVLYEEKQVRLCRWY